MKPARAAALALLATSTAPSVAHAGPYGFGLGDDNDRREAYNARSSNGPTAALGLGWNTDGDGRVLPAFGLRTIGYHDADALAAPRSAVGLEVGFREGEVRPQLQFGFGVWRLLAGFGIGAVIDDDIAFLFAPEASLPLVVTAGRWRPTIEPFVRVELVGGGFEHRAGGGLRVILDWP